MLLEPIVFVVDDDPAVRALFQAFLECGPWQVQTFAEPTEFLDSFDRNRHGCLILDYELPGMNGLCVLERLKAEGATLPVIVVSGCEDDTLPARAMESGAWTFIEKMRLGDRKYLFDNVRHALRTDVQHRPRLSSYIA